MHRPGSAIAAHACASACVCTGGGFEGTVDVKRERDNEKKSPPRRSGPWARAPGGAASSPLCSGTSSTAQCAGGHCIHKQTYQQSHQPGTVTVTVTAVVTASTKNDTWTAALSHTSNLRAQRVESNVLPAVKGRGAPANEQVNHKPADGSSINGHEQKGKAWETQPTPTHHWHTPGMHPVLLVPGDPTTRTVRE